MGLTCFQNICSDGEKATQDQFYLIAADPHDGKVEDKLNEVINAKYEAGILKPYNYVNGYARLQRYMDQQYVTPLFSQQVLYPSLTYPCFFSMTPSSRQRILNVMGAFRPAFRDVAQALTDVDLILVEEAFERLLLV